MAFPVECTPGADCHVQQFVDHDPGPGASDFRCGAQTYDGHKGTDIRLATEAELAQGVAVLAVAPGTVRAVRDEMPDAFQHRPGAPDVGGVECGNGVVISHGDGWETQYCHLALGSVTVRPGQTVGTGTPLGTIGASGETEFPHLHLSVRRDGAVVDPFDPDGQITCGAPSGETLWTETFDITAGGLLAVGFSDGVPEFDAIKAGTAAAPRLDAGGPALVAWGFVFGSRAGDVLTLVITGPDGREVFRTADVLERPQAQLFRAGGRRTPPGGWPPGAYSADVILERDGAVLDRVLAEITVD